LKGLALLTVIAGAGFAAIEYFKLRPRIDDETVAQFRPGMTETDIAKIIGAPPGDYGYGAATLSFDPADETRYNKWIAHDRALVVEFDDKGLVVGYINSRVYRPYDSLWDRLLRTFGARPERKPPESNSELY